MGEKRDAYVERLKNQLDEWNLEIDRLEQTANVVKYEAETEARDRIARLRGKRDEFESKLKEVRAAGEDAWEILKDGVERAQTELKQAFDDAKTHVTDRSPKIPR